VAVVPPDAEARLRDGAIAIVPTDTVYGIAAAAYRRPACERLYQLKRRPLDQPTAIVLGSVDNLLENVLPELMGRAGVLCRRAFPGPWTLVVPNPGRRFAYLCGQTPDRIGVRVPELDPDIARMADVVAGLAMSSGNLRGEDPPSTLDAVAPELREQAAFEIDSGPLPGTPSAVVDVTGPEPRVIREGPRLDELLEHLRS
jgi:tRNA threonylcarbamoyl adenosine modification protein (Sua5/YciO/YrdC/YwlC family)